MVGQRIKRVLIIFSVGMNVGLSVFAAYHYAAESTDKRARHEAPRMSFYRDLSLTPKQEEDIKRLVHQYAAQQRELRKQNKDLEMGLVKAIMDTPTDTARLEQSLDQIGALKRKREKLTVDHIIEIKSILTDQQSQAMLSRLIKQAEKSKD